ncbi:hypothetical protein, partial [Escherichia coli]|uniref:hypothetical protein n=1 Tax=Escherichia coli TaxID=562 RepID=UPI00159B88E8
LQTQSLCELGAAVAGSTAEKEMSVRPVSGARFATLAVMLTDPVEVAPSVPWVEENAGGPAVSAPAAANKYAARRAVMEILPILVAII